MGRFYLLNGNKNKANVVQLKVNGELQQDFDDIADLDLATMDISSTEKDEVLKDFNSDIILTDSYVDIDKKKNKNESHGTIFDYEDIELSVLYDELRDLAERRSYNKKNKNTVALEKSETREFRDDLLKKIIESDKHI